MRSVTRILFSLRVTLRLRRPQSDRVHQSVDVVDHTLIQPIWLTSLLLLKVAIAGNWSKQSCSQWRIDAFEQFQEHEADRVTAGRQTVSA